MTRSAKLRTIVRSVFAAGILGPMIGAVLILPFGQPGEARLSMIPEFASAGVMLFGPIAGLGGLVAGGVAIVLARYPVNTRTKGTWVGRGVTVGVASGAAAILLMASLLRAWGSGVVWAYAGLAAVSGGAVGALVGFLTWPDAAPAGRAPHRQSDRG